MSELDTLVDDLVIISSNCKQTVDSFGQAYKLIDDGAHIVKIPNQPLKSIVMHRADGSCGILADFISNFHTLQGKPLGHLDTDAGAVAIPQFWPTKPTIQQKYGIPRREGEEDLLVDVFIVNSYWSQKLNNLITDLPAYKTTPF